jgi:hypothetical protein
MKKIDIHLITEEEDKVEFSFEKVDYICYYKTEIVQSEYPVTHNTRTNEITYAVDEFMYNYIKEETLKREDGLEIINKDDVCKNIELYLNGK